MKNNIFLIAFILFTSLSFSQVTKPVNRLIYLDSTWNQTDEENHTYYRIVNDYYSKKDYYTVNDYFKSGITQMTGKSSNKDYLHMEGQCVYYHENGKRKIMCTYEDGKKTGKQYEWYDTGSLKLEAEYIANNKEKTSDYKINQSWDATNNQTVINGNGFYEKTEDLTYPDESNMNAFSEKGAIKNGVRNGIWTGSSTKLKASFIENYENGKCVSGTSTDYNNLKYNYTQVLEKAVPENGMNSFYNYIAHNFNTPKVEGLGGRIYMTFIIDKNGKLTNPVVLRDIGYETGKEAIRIINEAKNWIPGKVRGIAVSVFYSIPITIEAK